MPLRRESSETLYPFTPACEAGRARIAGIVDAYMLVVGEPAPAESSSSSSEAAGTHAYRMILDTLVIGPADNTYIFQASAPGMLPVQRTFTLPRNAGLARAVAIEDGLSFLLANTARIPVLPGLAGSGLDLELEPARVVWQLERVSSIRLTNEWREPDPARRDEELPLHPDRTVLLLRRNGDVLDLVDGYNCHLEYDPENGILTVNAGPGLGKGLPADIPWDRPAVDVFTGIRSVNGLNVDGNVELRFGQGLAPVYGAAKITIRIMAD